MGKQPKQYHQHILHRKWNIYSLKSSLLQITQNVTKSVITSDNGESIGLKIRNK